MREAIAWLILLLVDFLSLIIVVVLMFVAVFFAIVIILTLYQMITGNTIKLNREDNSEDR